MYDLYGFYYSTSEYTLWRMYFENKLIYACCFMTISNVCPHVTSVFCILVAVPLVVVSLSQWYSFETEIVKHHWESGTEICLRWNAALCIWHVECLFNWPFLYSLWTAYTTSSLSMTITNILNSQTFLKIWNHIY